MLSVRACSIIRRLFAAIGLFLCVTSAASAQALSGIVTEQDGAPLPGVFVILLDSAHVQRAATLTDAHGHYAFHIPTPGRYSLRAELIGHQSVTVPIDGTRSATANIALPVSPILIGSIEAKAERRCVGVSQLTPALTQLWEDARKALRVTAWAERTGPYQLIAQTYRRTLDPYDLHTLEETISADLHRGRLYTAVSADTLARYGYARIANGDSIAFYGPDAETLLSDAFADTHCFGFGKAQNDSARLAGLVFKPVKRRDVPDIAGTIWLDPRTDELKRVDFDYTGLPAEIASENPGGRTMFRHLPNGAWIVNRWWIRTPMIGERMNHDHVLLAYGETGGEVVDVRNNDQTVAIAPLIEKTTISGVVFDSTRKQPVRDAIVYLSSTSHRTRTDTLGQYALPDVPEGEYLIDFWSVRMDSVPATVPATVLHVRSGALIANLAIPSTTTLLRTECGTAHSSLLFGFVYGSDGVAAPHVHIAATIQKGSVHARRETVSTERGRYAICVPAGSRVMLTGDNLEPVQKYVAHGFRRLDLSSVQLP